MVWYHNFAAVVSQIAVQPVNVTTEQCDGSNTLNNINTPEINKQGTVEVKYGITLDTKQMTKVE